MDVTNPADVDAVIAKLRLEIDRLDIHARNVLNIAIQPLSTLFRSRLSPVPANNPRLRTNG